MHKVKIGVLVSGGGTNLQALMDACENGEISGEVVLVISNREGVYALERAEKMNIRNKYLDPKKFPGEAYDKELLRNLKEEGVELVVLAGYLRVLSPLFIEEFRNRIINIHPSLIPDFCGKGFYGERVHKAVLESGVKKTGATVHLVDEGTDTGPILMQESVPVLMDDTVETIQKRVLEVEHKILVKAVGDCCIRIDNENIGGNDETSVD
ncbi:phosphoribosylglycinamide formyltransferase [Gudongella sp. DL1XJH-153]|uniref:phosphoribosylglycinamide formyltransferase n=1 Tax=Gudongella sp. DL1XJH-153 TaxID=3409804 RepID=UPI003BB5BAC8